MNISKHFLVGLLCIIHQSLALDFIDVSLKDFIQRIVAQEHHKEFYDSYTALMRTLDSLGTTSSIKKKQELSKLRTSALWSLEANHPGWALALKPCLQATAENNQQKKLVDTFLIRYGAYQEFLKNLAKQRASVWYRVKSYSKHLSSRVVNFFSATTKPVKNHRIA